jgi:hypothetical protein
MKGFLLKYGLPILIVSVVISQFYLAYFERLSRWKGGGFGMYSEWQPEKRQVWIVVNDSAFIINNPKKHPRELVVLAHHLKFFPSDKKLISFGKKARQLLQVEAMKVQVWEPRLHSLENTVIRELIIEETFDTTN